MEVSLSDWAIFLRCLLNFPVECRRVLFSHPFFFLCTYFLWALFSESMVYHFTAMQMIPKFIYLWNEINMLLWNLFLHALMKWKRGSLNYFLFLNDSKTEVIVFGPSENSGSRSIDLDYLAPFTYSCIKNLGVFWVICFCSVMFSLVVMIFFSFFLLCII